MIDLGIYIQKLIGNESTFLLKLKSWLRENP